MGIRSLQKLVTRDKGTKRRFTKEKDISLLERSALPREGACPKVCAQGVRGQTGACTGHTLRAQEVITQCGCPVPFSLEDIYLCPVKYIVQVGHRVHTFTYESGLGV